MSQASSPTHMSKCSLSTSSLKTMKLLTRISSMVLTAWKACRSCSAASLSMCPDSLARKADAGWISSSRRRSSSVTGCWASQCTSRHDDDSGASRMVPPLPLPPFLAIVVAARLQCHCNTPAHPGRDGIPDDQGDSLAMAIDNDKLHEFLGKFVTDLGATMAAGNVVIGHNLGLYKALAPAPATAEELAAQTGTNPRYVAEWLRGQAAGGYVQYDPADDSYSMTEEQAFALTNPDGGVYAPGAFVLALGTLKAVPRITEAFRSGYTANLVPSWIPALDGVEDKLRAGAMVADVGCGLGASTILLAQAYPNSRITGSDYHDQSIELARKN